MLPKSESRADAAAKLKPGDIVLTTIGKRVRSPATPAGVVETAFRGATKKLQGEYTHSALYTGDGKVIELRHDTGLRKAPLNEATKNKDFLAVRPKAPATIRRQAVDTLERMHEEHRQGKRVEYASVPFLLKTVAEHITKGKRGEGSEEIEKNRFICSNLVTHAYPEVDFEPRKGRGYVIPKDFVESANTTPVVLHRNRRRHDRESSMKTSMSDPQVLAGFEAELDRNKVAFPATTVLRRSLADVGAAGRAILSGGLGLARKAGLGNTAKNLITKGTRAAGGGKNLSRLVGTGAVAGGAGLAAGGLAGRASS